MRGMVKSALAPRLASAALHMVTVARRPIIVPPPIVNLPSDFGMQHGEFDSPASDVDIQLPFSLSFY